MDYRDYRRKQTGGSSAPVKKPTSPQSEQVQTEAECAPVRRRPQRKPSRGTAKRGRAGAIRAAVLALVGAIVLVACLVAFSILTSGTAYENVARTVTVEIGRPWIVATDFLLEKNMDAEFAEGCEYDLDKIGKYKIPLIVNGEKCTSTLVVVDSVPPKAVLREFSARVGDSVEASEFVVSIDDATEVRVSFKTKPDTKKVGEQTVVVVLTDESGNKTEYDAVLNIVSDNELLFNSYVSELCQPMPPTTVFTGEGVDARYLSDVGFIDTSVPGIYMLQLEAWGRVFDVTVEVKDTVAPTATVTPQISYGALPEAQAFVSEIDDASRVTVSYGKIKGDSENLPLGRTDLEIVLTDEYGNTRVYETYITVEFVDTEAPIITKAPLTLQIDAGATAIMWRSKVEASDDSGEPDVYLDTADADLNTPGQYTVFIVARDRAGNETKRAVQLLVKDTSVSDEMLNSVLDSIIAANVNKEAVPAQQVFEVYAYIYSNLKYSNTAAHDDWRREAYLALTSSFKGDCFTHCAVGYALLDRLGFEVMIAQRADEYKIEGTGTHFWVMVNIGTESAPQWYHFDATPQREPFHLTTYLMTDAQIEAFTKWRNDVAVLENYYSHDTSIYPKSATAILVDLEIPAQYFD